MAFLLFSFLLSCLFLLATQAALAADRDLAKEVADHRAKAERTIAESHKRMARKREEMRQAREERARATEVRAAERKRENAERSAAADRARAARLDDARERREARVEEAGLAASAHATKRAQTDSESKRMRALYWAKQFSLVASVLGAGVIHAVVSRRKRKQSGPKGGAGSTGAGPSATRRRPA